MAKEKFNRTKSSHVKIGVIGRVDDSRTKLFEEITKMTMMSKGENQKSDLEMLEVEIPNNVDKSITINNAHKRIIIDVSESVDNNANEATDELKR